MLFGTCSNVSGTCGPHVEQYGMKRNGFQMSSAAAVAGTQSVMPNTAAVTVAAAFTFIDIPLKGRIARDAQLCQSQGPDQSVGLGKLPNTKGLQPLLS